MQAYSPQFARVYNALWTDFANAVAPRLRALYEPTAAGQARLPVLDLCCGTGQVAKHFLDHGHTVTGLDLSPGMLEYAARNNAAAVAEGRARFVVGDAASFALPERFGLVASTFDALNHLPDLDALRGCFHSAAAALAPGGLLVFDLNTRVGLGRWAGQLVHETPDISLFQRGWLEFEAGKAWMRIVGFVRGEDGRYERMEETVYNTLFEMRRVRQALEAAGFTGSYAALPEDLATPIDDPEQPGRVFFVARQPEAPTKSPAG